MNKKGTFFTTERFKIFGEPVVTILSVLNAAMDGVGSVSVTASKRGISIKLNGKTLVSGKTPTELHEAFRARQTKALGNKEGKRDA